ncbi:MAG: hypothetical protein JXO22_14150, partial [Phycisphaerae bacterium]|nr:hypothetical protein [Phycisphaerae bacterium]
SEDEVEPLDFAPVDEEAEREQRRLEEETRALRREVMSDTTLPADTGGPDRADSSLAPPSLDMDTLIVQYATAMAQGKLNEAAEFAGLIRRDMSAAEDAIQQLMSDEMLPGPLAATPRPVLVAFFKQLQSGKI